MPEGAHEKGHITLSPGQRGRQLVKYMTLEQSKSEKSSQPAAYVTALDAGPNLRL